MRLLLVGMIGVSLAGCSRREEPATTADASPREMRTFDVAQPPSAVADRAGGPGIDVAAAPGVAFSYRDAFRLPSDNIAPVQEAHAQACEKLGIARCRITGMRFRKLGENNVEAELAFKLAPDTARGFTREAAAAVEHAEGTLVDAEITGTDAGAVIDRAAVDRARAADELKRLDAAIAAARNAAERVQLQAQRAEIARQIAAATDTTTEARASLATTPVTFRYESGPAVRGFDTSAPFTSAINTGLASIETTLAIVLAILAIFGPPALVIGLVLWAVFAFRRRLRARRPAMPVAGPSTEATS